MVRSHHASRSANVSRRVVGGALAAVVAAGAAYAVPSTATATPDGKPAAAKAPAHHLSTRLSTLTEARREGLGAAETARELGLTATGPGSLLRVGNKLVVDVRMSSYGPGDVAAVEAAGGKILNDDPHVGYLTVAVAPDDLAALGDVPGVQYVGEELTPMASATCDTTISEGDARHQANSLRALGVDGTGLKVGVLSDSYNFNSGSPTTNASQDTISDNLPGTANTCGHNAVPLIDESPTAAPDEGRAMMQIVHDLAPGAALDFATANPSEANFASNITQLADQGANVIVDDITYFAEPMYQDGIIEQAVSGVRARGVDYFTDAANNRQVKNGHEVGSYEAVAGYRPMTCPAIIPVHADCHNFGTAGAPDNTFTYTANPSTTIRTILNWAEPVGGVTTDFDLYFVNETTNAVLTSDAINPGVGGSQKAFEFVSFTHGNMTPAPIRDIIVARKSSVAPAGTPRFKFVFAANGPQLFASVEHETPAVGTDVMGPTTFGHNGGADAMSVGASDVRVATALKVYSSYGPVTLLFGPVNGSTPAAPLPAPVVLAKPDVVASECGRNTFFGELVSGVWRFCGTSAAAPHAAAVAALLRQKFPAASVEAINNAMISTGTPIPGVPGSFQGGGLVNALAAANKLTPPPPPTPDTVISKTPKKTVKTKKSKAKVSFTFSSTVAGSTFACSIDGGAFTACTSGVTYKLKKGKHTFAVRASASGVTDATPASYAFKVKRKKKK